MHQTDVPGTGTSVFVATHLGIDSMSNEKKRKIEG